MLYPNYKIELGSETFTPDSQSVISFAVKLGLGPKVDSFEVVLAKEERSLKITRNDSVKVHLGYAEDLIKVFSGMVNMVDQGFVNIRVACLGSALNFLWLRLNKVYVNQTAGQIVSDLISSLKERLEGTELVPVSRGEIMDGRNFPVYIIDDRLNAYEHIEKLANKSNFIFYTSANNELFFKKYEKKEEHVLKYGEDLLEVNVTKMVGPYDTVFVYGESPASWAGRETYHWLAKKEVVGLSSWGSVENQKDVSGSHLLAVQDYTIKDNETVSAVAGNVTERVNREFRIMLKVIGNSKINVNDTVKVEGVEESSLGSSFRVTDVEHYLDKVSGFISVLTCMEEERSL